MYMQGVANYWYKEKSPLTKKNYDLTILTYIQKLLLLFLTEIYGGEAENLFLFSQITSEKLNIFQQNLVFDFKLF